MLLSTTSSLQDKKILEYKGIVNGNAIVGVNALKDMFASFRDFFGGRSAAYEEELNRAKQLAMDEMIEQARTLGANAIIGIDIDFESIQVSGSMLMVNASGTAVVIE
jgi:uncharacterized protein YbjQ (UPF0145 family)